MDSFELILRDLEEKEQSKLISKQEIIEVYKNRKYMKDIENEDSLIHQLMTHSLLQKDPDTLYLPYL